MVHGLNDSADFAARQAVCWGLPRFADELKHVYRQHCKVLHLTPAAARWLSKLCRWPIASSRERSHEQATRGIASFQPRANMALLDQIQTVLEEYREQLPLTCRQIFYRLVGSYGYDKPSWPTSASVSCW